MNIIRLIAFSLVTMVMIPMGVIAHPCIDNPGDHREGHPHCSNVPQGGGGVIADSYSINITGEIEDENAGGFSGAMLDGDRKGVGRGSFGAGGFGLGIFFDSIVDHDFGSPPDGEICFPTHPVTPHMATDVAVTVSPQLIIKKGKKGRAEAHIWFHGSTDPIDPDNPLDSVLYLLLLLGTFDEATKDIAWPPPPGGSIDSLKTMTMTTWETSIENQGADIKSKSCIAGPLPIGGADVHIEILGN